MIFPLLLVGGGLATLAYIVMTSSDTPPVHEPDMALDAPPPPGMPKSTRYRLVDAILPQLKQAADSSRIPLGLLVGWIARESGGRLGETTKLDERGLFQLMPSESKALGLDHQKLSTDVVYSINGGLLLIAKYMRQADELGIAPKGSSYYWRVVKFLHTMGTGAVNKIIKAAKDAGQTGSWEALEKYAMDNNEKFLHETKHSPVKWCPLVDAVYQVGAPFGFGGDQTMVVGASEYNDIPDVLDVLPRL